MNPSRHVKIAIAACLCLAICIGFIAAFAGRVEQYQIGAKDVLFIGHPYGGHGGGQIPYPPLKKFLENKVPQAAFFLGDLTEDNDRFGEFHEYAKRLSFPTYLVPGNHDGDMDLYQKLPYWSSANIGGILVGNLAFSEFQGRNVGLFAQADDGADIADIYVSHYVWFNQAFGGLRVANSMYGASPDLRQIIADIGSPPKGLFIAGDCGAYSHRVPFAKAVLGNSIFICTGMGGGHGIDHVLAYSLDKKTVAPIFFDSQGMQISHSCKAANVDGTSLTTCTAR